MPSSRRPSSRQPARSEARAQRPGSNRAATASSRAGAAKGSSRRAPAAPPASSRRDAGQASQRGSGRGAAETSRGSQRRDAAEAGRGSQRRNASRTSQRTAVAGGRKSDRMERGSSRMRSKPKGVNPMVYLGIGGGVLLLVIIMGVALGSGGGERTSTGSNTASFDGSGSALLTQGQQLLARAQGMAAGPGRNAAYREAAAVFSRAQEKLQAAGQSEMAVEANRHRYACMKMITE